MKNRNKLLLPLLCGLMGITCHSQDILWEKSYGGKHADYLMDVQPTADYGFILAGSSLSKKSGNKTDDNKGDLDYWVWKMNESGDLDWQKSFGGNGNDFLQSIALTNDGGFILGGTSNSNISFDKKSDCKGQNDLWIVKLNAKGGEEWQLTLGGSGQDKMQVICKTNDGGYIIGGSSSSIAEKSDVSASTSSNNQSKTCANYGNLDYWIIKIDSKGKVVWQQSFGGTYSDELRSLQPTADGGYIVGGYSNSPASGNKTQDAKGVGDYWILKLNDKGIIQWQKTIGADKDDQLYAVHQAKDGGYLLGGNSNSDANQDKTASNADGTDFWVLKLDDKGAVVWQQTYNFGAVDVLTSLTENEDGTILIGGYAQGTNSIASAKKQKQDKGIDDYIALKINSNGEELWSKTVGSNGQDLLRKVIQTRDGGYLMAGTSDGSPQLTTDKLKGLSGKAPLTNALQGDNVALTNAKNEINQSINSIENEANKTISNTTKKATDVVKDNLGITNDGPIKLGSNAGDVVGLPGLGNGNDNGGNSLASSLPEKKLPSSRDKTTNYGNHDFWVVKLKDKAKTEEVKVSIEAFPNPTYAFTNVIIGYEFKTGTVTVVDLAGRQLQQFEINSRTVPIDLSSYPDGIYVVNIKAHVHSDGVKIIKGSTKN